MPFRSILLRVLFCSLALAAGLGAMGILLASHSEIWRIAATSITTAGASLLLLAASAKMDKPAARTASLLAVTLVVMEYLLTLGAIWEIGALFGRYSDSIWLTIVFLGLVAVPAIVFMRMTATALTALAGRVGLVLAALELAMLLGVAWDQSSLWTTNGDVDELAAWLPLFALLVVACLIGQGVKPRRFWRWIGVAAAALGYGATAYGILKNIHFGGDMDMVVVYLTCTAAAIAHANIVLLCPLRRGQAWLRWLTIGAGLATAFFVMMMTYAGNTGSDLLPRLAGACGVIAGCGTLALAIMARLNRPLVVAADAMSGLSEITLICPVCRKKQSLGLGGAACSECGVLIQVRIEEPKCATCGYSLLQLQSGVCPECGTATPARPPRVRPDALAPQPANPAIKTDGALS